MTTKVIGILILGVLLLCAGSFYMGESKGHTRAIAEGNAKVAELQNVLSQRTTELHRAVNRLAEETSRAKQAEKERIDAISTNDHQSERIKNLQRELDRLANLEPADNHYIVVDTDAIKRVLTETMRGGGQTGFITPRTVQAYLSADTAVYPAVLNGECLRWRRDTGDHEIPRQQLQRVRDGLQLTAW